MDTVQIVILKLKLVVNQILFSPKNSLMKILFFFFFTFNVSLFVLHHKHAHNPHFIEAHRNYLSTEHIKENIYQEKVRVLSGGIRANINADDMRKNII